MTLIKQTLNGLRQPDDHAVFENFFVREWQDRLSLENFSRATMMTGLPQTIFTSGIIEWEPHEWRIHGPLSIQLISYPETKDIQVSLMGEYFERRTQKWEYTPFILRHFYSPNSYYTLVEFSEWAEDFLLELWPLLKANIRRTNA